MKKFLFLFIFLSTSLFAQSGQDQFNKQVEEIMKAREEMLKSLLDDSMSGSLEKRMLEMMKRFDQDDFGFGEMESSLVVGEYDWIDSKNYKTLKIKVTQVKDRPLDIKIEKGMITIKGDVESTQGSGKNKVGRKVHFERSFSLPDDIDQTGPEFENAAGELLIKFKKLVKSPTKKEKGSVDRVPVSPNKDDLNI